MIRFVGCPESNFHRGRPFGLRPEAIVVHLIDGSFAAGESVFRDPNAHKSAHYAVSRDGEIHQYVDENDTAFHAGIVVNPTWSLLKPRINPNFYTIGIEHEGRPDDEWAAVQMSASAGLIAEIARRWDIPLDEEHVIRHHQIRASKTCPGNWLKIEKLLKLVPTQIALGAAATASSHAMPILGTISPPHEIDVRPTVGAAITTATSHLAGVSSPLGLAALTATTVQVVRTIRNVNLRRQKPATTAQLVRVIPANTEVAVMKFETGERVDGNAFWYVDAEGNYLWAGATSIPDPTVATAQNAMEIRG